MSPLLLLLCLSADVSDVPTEDADRGDVEVGQAGALPDVPTDVPAEVVPVVPAAVAPSPQQDGGEAPPRPSRALAGLLAGVGAGLAVAAGVGLMVAPTAIRGVYISPLVRSLAAGATLVTFVVGPPALAVAGTELAGRPDADVIAGAGALLGYPAGAILGGVLGAIVGAPVPTPWAYGPDFWQVSALVGAAGGLVVGPALGAGVAVACLAPE